MVELQPVASGGAVHSRGNYIKQSNTSFDHQLRNLLVITLQNAEFVPSNKPFTLSPKISSDVFFILKSSPRFSLVKVAPVETLTLVTRSHDSSVDAH